MTDRKKWEPGVSSVILHYNGGFTKEGFAELKKNGISFAEASFTHRELTDIDFYDNPEKLFNIASNSGVTLRSFHIPFDSDLHPACIDEEENRNSVRIIEQSVRAAAKIGIKTMVIHPSSEPNSDDERKQKTERSIENMCYFSKLCKELGAVLAVEDLPRSCLGNDSNEIMTFLNSVPDLQLCFDTNHLLKQSNEDFLNDLIAHGMKGKIGTIHVSDYDFVNERHRLPFDGINDWNMILSKLEELDYDGVFMYEVSKPFDREKAYTLKDIADNYKKIMNN